MQALNRSVAALQSSWEGGCSEDFGSEAHELVRLIDAQANALIELAGRLEREASEWEEIDRRGAEAFRGGFSSGGGISSGAGGVSSSITMVSITSLLAGLPIWLKSLLGRFFPSPTVDTPVYNKPVISPPPPGTTRNKFGEILEKAKKEAEKQKEKAVPKPKYINKYPPREDDGTEGKCDLAYESNYLT